MKRSRIIFFNIWSHGIATRSIIISFTMMMQLLLIPKKGSIHGLTPPFVTRNLDTLLVPVSGQRKREMDHGEVHDKITIHNGGAFTIEVLKHTVQYTER